MSKELGAVLREGRKHLKLTQAQVAHRLGVSRAAVGQWEAGDDPATDNLIGICRELGIEVEPALSGTLKHIPGFAALTPARRVNSEYKKDYEHTYIEKYPYNLPNYFVDTGVIPFYSTFKRIEGMAIQVTESPVFFTPREPEIPPNNNLYLMGIADSNMSPVIPKMSIVVVDGGATPTTGDLVIVRFDDARVGDDGPKANVKVHKTQTAVIGYLSDYTATDILVSQLGVHDRMAVPISDITAIHRILPPARSGK